jgi:hypothetical protein
VVPIRWSHRPATHSASGVELDRYRQANAAQLAAVGNVPQMQPRCAAALGELGALVWVFVTQIVVKFDHSLSIHRKVVCAHHCQGYRMRLNSP